MLSVDVEKIVVLVEGDVMVVLNRCLKILNY